MNQDSNIKILSFSYNKRLFFAIFFLFTLSMSVSFFHKVLKVSKTAYLLEQEIGILETKIAIFSENNDTYLDVSLSSKLLNKKALLKETKHSKLSNLLLTVLLAFLTGISFIKVFDSLFTVVETEKFNQTSVDYLDED